MTQAATHESSPAPLLRVTPTPTDEELAAITAVLLPLLAAEAEVPAALPVSAWRRTALREGVAGGMSMHRGAWMQPGMHDRS